MTAALRVSLAYLAFAFALDLALRGSLDLRLASSLVLAASPFTGNEVLIYAVPALILAALAFRSNRAEVLRRILTALLLTVLVQTAYSTVKADLPLVTPFFADAWLARADAALHGGTDPWRILHAAFPDIPTLPADVVYLVSWTAVAIGLPLLVAATDGDPVRRRHATGLWVGIWPVLGNGLALLGLSGGPIYHDRLTGSAAFADLPAAQAAAGIDTASAGRIMRTLWEHHETGAQAFGSGISAFPSMHVAAATLAALYLSERFARLAPLFLGWAAVILFLSVWYGWHYALDGYVSALSVAGTWFLLRRRPAIRNVPAAATA